MDKNKILSIYNFILFYMELKKIPEGLINGLPNDMIIEIINLLEEFDFVNFGSTCKNYYKYLNKHRTEQCSNDVSYSLDQCSHDAMSLLPQNKIENLECGIGDDGVYVVDDKIKCTRFEVYHDIECKYVRFRRDVDLLYCYVDGKCVCNRMM